MPTIINKDEINLSNITKIMNAFSGTTDIPVTFFNDDMQIVFESNKNKKICLHNPAYTISGSACCQTLAEAAENAAKQGEAYVYICPSGFINIAVAALQNDHLLGCFVAGPMTVGEATDKLLARYLKTLKNDPETFGKLTSFTESMTPYSPKQISEICHLFESCINGLLGHKAQYEKLENRYRLYSRISKIIGENNLSGQPLEYPYELEKALIEKVKSGDAEGALNTLEALLSDVILVERGDIRFIRVHILEICTVLSRTAVECGTPMSSFFRENFDYINALYVIDNIQDLCAYASRITERFSKSVFQNIYSGKSDVISAAVHYIHGQYMNKVTLKSLSAHLHINESYFSKLFKQEMGQNFTDYLNAYRIKKSMELLKNMHLSLLDVALCVGFEDQSYFAKVFKKVTGKTPRVYRSGQR